MGEDLVKAAGVIEGITGRAMNYAFRTTHLGTWFISLSGWFYQVFSDISGEWTVPKNEEEFQDDS